MTLVEKFLAQMEQETFSPRERAESGGVLAPLSPAPDSAHPDELRRAYEETVDPMFDRYDEEDWF